MKINGVSTAQCYRGIPLYKWESVEAALNTFASGSTKGSRETERKQLHDVGESSGGFAIAFYAVHAPHMQGADNKFVEILLVEAKAGVNSRGKWQRIYDYDGMGVFFKTSVEIEMLDKEKDLYNLQLYAAYVGDEPEKGLAETLGIPRNLIWSSVTVHVEPEDAEHFAFDFEQLLRKLDLPLGCLLVHSYDVTSWFMEGDRYSSVKPFVISKYEHVVVTVIPGRVERRFVFDGRGQVKDTWTRKGLEVLQGLLDESYEDRSKKEPPTIILTVRSSNEDGYGNSCPIWDEQTKKLILNITERIAGALKP